MRFLAVVAALALATLVPHPAPAAEPAVAKLEPMPARIVAHATLAQLLDVTWAGARMVAVGEQGVVLLSDDKGATVRQAKAVPVSSMLTSVSFADARRGWAVGHWGVILVTDDGGETWRAQRLAIDEDRPLFSVHFFDDQHGVAVGLWSLVLTTGDGGQTWTQRALSPAPGTTKADLNLLHLFADAGGVLYAAAERGFVLRSADRGATWTYLNTGYKGSFWSGVALPGGVLVVAGQRGTVYRSADGGTLWTRIETGSKSSITDLAHRDGDLLAVGLDGLVLRSRDGGQSFALTQRPDRLSLTAVTSVAGGGWIAATRRGYTALGAAGSKTP